MKELEVNIVMNHPDNVSHEEALADLTKILEQAGTVRIAKDEEGEETMIIDKDWVEEETAKEEERRKQREEDKKAIAENLEKARKFAESYPDADVPNQILFQGKVATYDWKLARGLEKYAEEELAQDNSPQDSERVRIYGRGSAY